MINAFDVNLRALSTCLYLSLTSHTLFTVDQKLTLQSNLKLLIRPIDKNIENL